MPNRFTEINSLQGLKTALNRINGNFRQLDAETYSKTIMRGGNRKAMTSGKLADGTYGLDFYDSLGRLVIHVGEYGASHRTCIIVYDSSSKARILIGQAPDDGRAGVWVSNDGVDVLKELGG